jgi:hypothetical protein
MPKRESCGRILLAPRPPSRSPPTYDPHSTRCTAGCHTPAISCIGAFRTPAPQRVDSLVVPASENLHKCGHSRMLKHIAEFFALEKDIRSRSAGRASSHSTTKRPAARRCIPEVATHKACSDQSEGQARRRDPLYALALEGLTRFLDDGHIKLDNCPVESSIRLSSSTGKMRSSPAPTAA